MGQQQRRPGFLRWGEPARGADADATAEATENAAAAPVEQAPTGDAAAATAETAGAAEAGEQAVGATETGATPSVAPSVEAPQAESPFLRDLVGAMRGVAESSRDATLGELRGSVDARLEELKTASGERAEELRRRSELDLGGIGDWERSELERVRAEAEERRKARRELLEKELADHQAATDRDLEALRGRLSDYEREMDAFFAQLAEIDDPAAFVAAAKRLPPAPDLATPVKGATHAAPKASDSASSQNGTAQPPAEADTLAERLAQLDERLGISSSNAPSTPEPAAIPAEAAATTPSTAEEVVASSGSGIATATATATAPAAAPAAAPAGAETSTPIVVKGLGSFGAITSFKQALERVDGIRGVTLSLGPTGDFVYRASHAADFDLIGAIRSIEGPNAGIEETDGQVRVTIERPR